MKYGEEAWENVRKMANIDTPTFSIHQVDDEGNDHDCDNDNGDEEDDDDEKDDVDDNDTEEDGKY